MSVRPNHRVAAVAVAVVALSTAGQLAQASAADLPTSSITTSVSQPASAPAQHAAAPTDLSVILDGSVALVSFVDQTAGVAEHVVSYGDDDDIAMATLPPGVEHVELTDLQGSTDYVLTVQSVVDGSASKVKTIRFSTS